MNGALPDRSPRLVAAALLIAGAALGGCHGNREVVDRARELTGGDPDRGRWALRKYGCASCHTIPGVKGAHGLVGPPLTRIASRVYLAGHLPNTPENMIRWVQHPRKVHPPTAMPEMGVTEPEARDIAAYLYTLR
jgi:cytochrome c2